jgi:hypothetical protein
MQRTAGNVPGTFKFGAGDYTADPGYAFRCLKAAKRWRLKHAQEVV